MEAGTKNLDDALLTWAFWMTLFVCILSIPLCLFFLLLLGSANGVSSSGPSFWQFVTPLFPAVVAWTTLDVLTRARRNQEEQHGIAYLSCVATAAVVTTGLFGYAFLSSAHGSGLALICTVFAAVPSFAILHILDAKRTGRSVPVSARYTQNALNED